MTCKKGLLFQSHDKSGSAVFLDCLCEFDSRLAKRISRCFPSFQDISRGQIVLPTRSLSVKRSETNVSFLSFLSS